MKMPSLWQDFRPNRACARGGRELVRIAAVCGLIAVAGAGAAAAQVVTIDSHTGAVTNGTAGVGSTVDRRYQQIQPTKVAISKIELNPRTRQELIRALQSEQGFAMRPFPRGHKGLTLVANGKLEPAGEAYLNMATSQGLSAKPGDRLVLTDVRFEHSKIVFDLNGGPDKRHRLLSHVQVGAGPMMNPVVQDDGKEPTGARLSLAFDGHVPEMTGAEVKALLAPLISFDVKTPVQAFTDTLPDTLRQAILSHKVLVGMSTDMLLFAKGQPETKTREMDGQMPFEEWIYGKPPKEVDFVRINGNRVIRLEVAKMGETPVVFTRDEVAGLMRSDGTPVVAEKPGVRTVEMGDVEHNSDTQAPAAPPSLRDPGETLPDDTRRNGEVMRPVQFPKPKTDPQPGANPDEASDSGSTSGAQAPANTNSQSPPPKTPAGGSTPPN